MWLPLDYYSLSLYQTLFLQTYPWILLKIAEIQRETMIFVVVDKLTKYAHFLPMSHPFTAVKVDQIFLDNVYKLHGFPSTIVSDRDPIFMSIFWKELFKLQGVELLHSTAYHPQMDGQNEVVNRCLETYLRYIVGDLPRSWSSWVALAEFWYN